MDTTQPTWICRNFRPGDEPAILQLYRDVFQLEMSPELWNWAYRDAPDGPAVIAVLALGDRIVGHYAVQPRKFWIGPRLCTAGIAIGTMILPEIRGLAGLVALARQAYATCRQRGLVRLYAFPNQQAQRVRCTLLGWRALPEIVECDGALPRKLADKNSDVKVWQQMPTDLDFDPFAASSTECTVRSARTLDWLAWRYFSRPGGEYVLHTAQANHHVTGYAVTKRYQRDGIWYGHIVDWQLAASAIEQAPDLLASVWKQLGQWNVERVSSWTVGDERLRALLAELGFTPTGRHSNFCDYDLEMGDDQRLSHPPAASDYACWQVVMADSDVY